MKIIGINLGLIKICPTGFLGIFCLLLLSGFFISACGSKQGNSSATVISGEFIPGSPNTPQISSTIFLDSLEPKSDTFLTIDVNVFNINSFIKSVKFNVEFSGSVIAFEDYIEGEFFGSNEDDVETIVTPSPSNIQVSISREDNAGRTGSNKLISIRFRLVGFSSSQLIFTGREVLPTNGPDISNSINWFGGTVVVR